MTFRCQLCHPHDFCDCDCSYSEVLRKPTKKINFLEIIKNDEWRHNGYFCCFQVRHSDHVFVFCWIFFKLTYSYLRLIFTFNHIIDWMYCDRSGRKIPGCLSVCLSVCLCVCVCPRWYGETTGPISMELSKNELVYA